MHTSRRDRDNDRSYATARQAQIDGVSLFFTRIGPSESDKGIIALVARLIS
jgi:hypothetical protein